MPTFITTNILGLVELWGQRLEPHDLVVIGLLVVLEGVLSIDNALVLGLLAKRLPKHQRAKALTYGLIGAFVFRFVAIALATYLLQWWVVKLAGGGYLVFVAVKHFLFDQHGHGEEDKVTLDADGNPVLVRQVGAPEDNGNENGDVSEIEQRTPVPAGAALRGRRHAGFWRTVVVIELTDIAFAIDSILAAIALVGSAPRGHTGLHPKLWVVVMGGMLGVILMRVAAAMFIKLLDRFPRFETAAYLLVTVIGLKLLADWWFNKPTPEHPHGVLDFHSPHSPAFWVFWVLMVACFCVGFLRKREKPPETAAAASVPPAG